MLVHILPHILFSFHRWQHVINIVLNLAFFHSMYVGVGSISTGKVPLFFFLNGYQLRSLFENTDSLVSLEYISKIVICLFILTALSLCCCVGFSLVE